MFGLFGRGKVRYLLLCRDVSSKALEGRSRMDAVIVEALRGRICEGQV
jgi:hypothetical protein